MQLQKQASRVYKGKEYPKYLIVIPPKDIEILGWKEGDDLESIIEDCTLTIRKK
jgi:bifunctional DNA-binding transcriptional regulator/antitoxin component of YhaV-PrlF toxin-antitoxin module